MSAFRLRWPNIKLIRRWSSSLSEYTEKPEYPPILDLSRDAVLRRQNEAWHNEIKKLESVEEKLMKMNMPRYYGWPCMELYEGIVPYDSLQFSQFVTRTYVYQQSQLPEFYHSTGIVDSCAAILEKVKTSVKNAIVLEHAFERSINSAKEVNEDVNDVGESVVQQIHRVILSSLSADFPHLSSCQVDFFPRIESSWIVGSIEPSTNLKRARKATVKADLGKLVDVKFQYQGRPIAQVRHKLLLPQIISEAESQTLSSSIPSFQYDPRVIGIKKNVRHLTNIPGFWPGDTSEFPLMSFHSSKFLSERPSLYDDNVDAPYVHVILASFGWLQALAHYQGFSTYQDITYPLVTQTVLSDGQHWSFYVFQLNTILLHSEYAIENSKCNICWGTEKLKLYDKVENGEVVGFNEEVLKILLSFYLNIPSKREGIELKPYLGDDIKYIADFSDQEKRCWLEKHFKHMYSNRPRHRLPYEIYNWEKIYKIDHKTRVQEARRRPFELDQQPHLRKYDEHVPVYIKKSKREHKRDKWEKTYYP